MGSPLLTVLLLHCSHEHAFESSRQKSPAVLRKGRAGDFWRELSNLLVGVVGADGVDGVVGVSGVDGVAGVIGVVGVEVVTLLVEHYFVQKVLAGAVSLCYGFYGFTCSSCHPNNTSLLLTGLLTGVSR